jgi:glycine betaine/proline transport system substrate-binding protein
MQDHGRHGVGKRVEKRTCSFLKKRTKKLLPVRAGNTPRHQHHLARHQTDKSFSVLFFKKGHSFFLLFALLLCLRTAQAAEPPACRVVKFADIGWTDISATTAVASRILQGLGYTPTTQILSVPVTYISLKNKNIDIFLGNWMPSMQADRAPYIADGSVQVVRTNLEGAKYTLAVPQATYDAGLHAFADIARFRTQLGGKIYGIEPGNDGNRVVHGLISNNKFALGDFDLVESSEQGMLAQLDRSIRQHQMIVFLGWEPHPMNLNYQIKYLEDPSNSFGLANGAATVATNVRAGYLEQCPNVGAFLKRLQFSLKIEDSVMNNILAHGMEAPRAAETWLKANQPAWTPWLDGVTDIAGAPAAPVLAASLGLSGATAQPASSILGGLDNWITGHKLPVGPVLSRGVSFATSHGQGFFDLVSVTLSAVISGITIALLFLPAPVMIVIFAAAAYWLHRSIGLTIFIVGGLLLVVNLGYWQAAIETLSLVFSATLFCVLIGVPLGIAAAHRPWLYQVLRPILDLMQTIPTFVYLIPTLVLFGLGAVPGLISTVIFSIPAPIRLTHLGITSVPPQLREAGEAFGATRTQLLFKVELPYALPTIMAGVTQCIMLSLSMVVIAALVGADGLGKPVVRALNSVNVSMGFEAGIAIVVLAIILDRVCKRPERA